MKKLYFVSDEVYYVISIGEDGEIRVLEETNDNSYLFDKVYEADEVDNDSEKCKAAAKAFLEAVEDDTSWETIDPEDDEMMNTIEEMIHPNYYEIGHSEVLAEIETDIL